MCVCWDFIQIWFDNKMLSSQWDNDNQHFVYIIFSWYLLGIITRQGFLFSCSCMNRCTCNILEGYGKLAPHTKRQSSANLNIVACTSGVIHLDQTSIWGLTVVFSLLSSINPTQMRAMGYSKQRNAITLYLNISWRPRKLWWNGNNNRNLLE